jgi:hypothetical protein
MNFSSIGAADLALRAGSAVEAFEEVLARNIEDVVGDLRLVDLHVMMLYVTGQLHGNLNDIVASSTELFFKSGTLTYARWSDIDVGWDSVPRVVLNMEFIHGPASVFFKLVLEDRFAGIEISEFLLNDNTSKALFDTSEFARVLLSARLKPLPLRCRLAPLVGRQSPTAKLDKRTHQASCRKDLPSRS